ncbi:hypothetical protein [uncultured Jatrophihabitans sp.]|uniref:hypothetical protein n=1 Tax=uncultured Jatrophihabitans sp. TaxID=1610747 RepID=UPI0035CB6C8D
MSDRADNDAMPQSIRRLDNPDAIRLVRLVGAYDDLQTVLVTCEQLLTVLGDPARGGADPTAEALWTFVLLCYARAFGAAEASAAAVTETDLDPAEGEERDDVVRRHRVLMHLRDHHADPLVNPRETYTVGVAQDDDGQVNAVAVTSVPSPAVDPEAVRHVGRLAYRLCAVLDARIGELQKAILAAVRDTPKDELEAMDRIEVMAT